MNTVRRPRQKVMYATAYANVCKEVAAISRVGESARELVEGAGFWALTNKPAFHYKKRKA
jgi:hypothetical protein